MRPENVSEKRWQAFLVKARNELAVLLSIIPGLGHIYKGYYLMGVGLILLIPVCFWAGTAVSAFMIEDHRKYHLFH